MKTVYGLPKKREEVIEELQTAFANQNLDEAEYEHRLKEALAAKSVEDLEVIVFDFPQQIRSKLFPKEIAKPAPMQQPNTTLTDLQTALTSTDGNTYRSILHEDKRQITQWHEPLHFVTLLSSQKADFRKSTLSGNHLKLHIECILGGNIIDLRNEDLAGKHIEIWLGGGLGEVKILLPRGGTIEQKVQLFGSSIAIKDKRKSWLNRLTGGKEAEAISFSLSLHGNFWLGGIEVVY